MIRYELVYEWCEGGTPDGFPNMSRKVIARSLDKSKIDEIIKKYNIQFKDSNRLGESGCYLREISIDTDTVENTAFLEHIKKGHTYKVYYRYHQPAWYDRNNKEVEE